MDSANILSILAGLQQPQAADSSNVLQTLAQPAPVNVDPSPLAPPPVNIDPNAIASVPAPRKRASLVDILGHLADGIAQAGGATPMYQKTLDDLQKNAFDAQDHAQQVDLNKLKLATGQSDLTTAQGKLTDAETARLGAAARGVKALMAANPNADPATIWPMLAKQAGIPDDQAQAIGAHIAQNPGMIDGLIAAGTDQKYDDQSRYGGEPVYAVGPDGKLSVFQTSLTGGPGRNILPEGYTPIDPLKFVDTGGSQVGVGTRTGHPAIVLPNTEKPGYKGGEPINEKPGFSGGEPIKEKPGFSGGRPIAPPPGKDATDPYIAYNNGVNSMRALDQSLNDLVTDPRLNGATGLINGRLNVTDDQRAIKGKIASLVGQGIPAAIAAIKASGGAAPRSVAEIMGEVRGLQGAIENRDMATPDYIATVTAARNRLRQRVNDMTNEAIRQGYVIRDSKGNVVPAPKKTTPAAPKSSGGWSVVGVK